MLKDVRTLFSIFLINRTSNWLLPTLQITGRLAAVDTTKETKLGSEFSIKGYPTIKYFRDGEFAFDVSSAREKDKIVEFMADPKVMELHTHKQRINDTIFLQEIYQCMDFGAIADVNHTDN